MGASNMDHLDSKRKYFLSLGLVGLASGFLTCCTAPMDIGGPLASFSNSGSLSSVWRALAFVVASYLAYFAAFLAASSLWMQWPGSLMMTALLPGGFLGAAILYMASYFLFSSHQENRRFFANMILCSVAGSLLAVLGWALGPLVGTVVWYVLDASPVTPDSGTASFYSLYVSWQAGMAVLLGWLALQRRAEQPTSLRVELEPTPKVSSAPAKPLAFVKKLALGSALLLIGLFAIREARHTNAIVHEKKEPSKENLPDIREIPVEGVLLLKPINGHPFGDVIGSSPGPLLLFPPVLEYSVTYYRQDSQGRKMEGSPVVQVSVFQHANAAWAKYNLKSIAARQGAASSESKEIPKVSKFRNSVFVSSSSGGNLCFFWASGNFNVLVHFYGPEEEEFLKEYLAQYPSSL